MYLSAILSRFYVPECKDYVPECKDYVPECKSKHSKHLLKY